MYFEEYQKQAITTRHRSYASTIIQKDLKYFGMGLIGETGELVEKVKKILRDDDGILTADRRLMIKKEIGDVIWYMTNICEETNLKMDDIHYKSHQDGYVHHGLRNMFDVVCLIAQEVGEISATIDKVCNGSDSYISERLYPQLCELFTLLEEFCTSCALEIQMVAKYNIEKLFSRKERGTITGDGDNR